MGIFAMPQKNDYKKAYGDKGGATQKAATANVIAASSVVVEAGGKARRKRRTTTDGCGAAKLDSRAAWHLLLSWGKRSSIEV